MESLPRSAISFRRQGSSGIVWDDKLISEELNKEKSQGDNNDNQKKDDDQKAELRRTKSDGGDRKVYRTVKVEQAEDPPSPRVSGCGFGFGFCSGFGKPAVINAEKKKSGKAKQKKVERIEY